MRRPRSRAFGWAFLVIVAVLAIGAAPGLAVTGWAGPTRVVAALQPLSPSVALDADGFVHMAYIEDSHLGPTGIFYATNRGGWHAQRVTTGDAFPAHPSLALDSAHHAYIAFARPTCTTPACSDAVIRIYVASNRQGDWHVTRRTSGPSDFSPSLAVHADRLYVAFQRKTFPGGIGSTASGVWLATNRSGAWVTTQVASAHGRCDTYQNPSLAIDAVGHAFIAFEGPRGLHQGCGSYSAGIRLATDRSGTWATSAVSSDRDDFGPSLALGSDGRPRVAFDRAGVGVEFARESSSGWGIPSFVAVGGEPDLALTASDGPRISFENGGIHYAVRSGSAWSDKPLYTGPVDYGTYSGPQIVITPGGKAKVIFARTEPDATPTADELGVFLLRQR